MPEATAKPASLEDLYPGISTEEPTDQEKDAALTATYPGMEMPTTAGDAAAEVGNGTIWISSVDQGSFSVRHANNAQTAREFGYLVSGG